MLHRGIKSTTISLPQKTHAGCAVFKCEGKNRDPGHWPPIEYQRKAHIRHRRHQIQKNQIEALHAPSTFQSSVKKKPAMTENTKRHWEPIMLCGAEGTTEAIEAPGRNPSCRPVPPCGPGLEKRKANSGHKCAQLQPMRVSLKIRHSGASGKERLVVLSSGAGW